MMLKTAERRALAKLADSGEVWGVVSKKIARILLADRYVRLASVDPAPARGIAVSLTVKGHSAAQAHRGSPEAEARGAA